MAKPKKFEYDFPRPAVTVDGAIFKYENNQLSMLLIERANEPFKGKWALPGGFVDSHESLELAISREIKEETNLSLENLKLCGAFGDPGRDPRGHTITIAYYTFITPEQDTVMAGSDAKCLQWRALQDIKALAFDHKEILEKTLYTVFRDIKYSLLIGESFFSFNQGNMELLLELINNKIKIDYA